MSPVQCFQSVITPHEVDSDQYEEGPTINHVDPADADVTSQADLQQHQSCVISGRAAGPFTQVLIMH